MFRRSPPGAPLPKGGRLVREDVEPSEDNTAHAAIATATSPMRASTLMTNCIAPAPFRRRRLEPGDLAGGAQPVRLDDGLVVRAARGSCFVALLRQPH